MIKNEPLSVIFLQQSKTRSKKGRFAFLSSADIDAIFTISGYIGQNYYCKPKKMIFIYKLKIPLGSFYCHYCCCVVVD